MQDSDTSQVLVNIHNSMAAICKNYFAMFYD